MPHETLSSIMSCLLQLKSALGKENLRRNLTGSPQCSHTPPLLSQEQERRRKGEKDRAVLFVINYKLV